MSIGILANSGAVLFGALLGILFKRQLSDKFCSSLTMVCGIIALTLGIANIIQYNSLTVVALTVLLGCAVGELLKLESKVFSLLSRLPTRTLLADRERSELFITVFVLFCFSSTGIIGAMQAGFWGDNELLLTKSILDFFTAMFFSVSLGLPVGLLAVPQLIVLNCMYFLAWVLLPIATPGMLADFSAVGGVLVLATGLRICKVVDVSNINMLPALVIAIPLSALLG